MTSPGLHGDLWGVKSGTKERPLISSCERYGISIRNLRCFYSRSNDLHGSIRASTLIVSTRQLLMVLGLEDHVVR